MEPGLPGGEIRSSCSLEKPEFETTVNRDVVDLDGADAEALASREASSIHEPLRRHWPGRAGGPPHAHRTGLPEASYRKPVRFTSLTNHTSGMIREQFLGVG